MGNDDNDDQLQEEEEQFDILTKTGLKTGVSKPRPPPSAASCTRRDEEEEMPTTQKKRKKPKQVCDKRTWTDNEALVLSRCWVTVSEDPVIGDSLKDVAFWGTIIKLFNKDTADGERNKSQLQGKWNKIKKTTKEFGAIFKTCSEKRGESSVNDKEVYDVAHKQFKKEYGKRFVYEQCYEVLKGFSEFWDDDGVMVKRTVPTIDLDDDKPIPHANPSLTPTIFLDDKEPIPQANPSLTPGMEQLFCEDPIRRAPGRNVSRKTGSSSDATSDRNLSDETQQKLDKIIKMQEEVLAKIDEDRKKAEEHRKKVEEHRKKKRIMDVFRFLQNPVPNCLPRKEVKTILAYRKSLMDEVGHLFSGGDSDKSDD